MSQQRSNLQATGEPGNPRDTRAARSADKARASELRAVSPAVETAVSPADGESGPPPVTEPASVALGKRLDKLESQNKRMKGAVLGLLLVVAYLGYAQLAPGGVIVKQQLLESQELKLLDNAGNPRLFLRMYSRVPVLQLLDSNGKPRMSLGMRFDDTPFIDLSDKSGTTRATFEMTAERRTHAQDV